MTNQLTITFSERALAHIADIRSMRPEGAGVGFRLGVKASGCSGWLYQPEVVDEVCEDDLVFTHGHLTVMVPTAVVELLAGTHVDLQDKGLGQKVLVYQNPNAEDLCGCGESFSLAEKSTEEEVSS